MAKGLASRNRFREASGIFLLNSIIAAPRTTSVSSHEKHCVEKRTVNQQSVQPCDRVQPCTNLPSTACSSKCLASQEIVPLTTNVHPQKNHCGVWTSDSDRDGDGDDNGDVFCSAVGLPTLSVTEGGGPIPLRWLQTCQSGTRRTERTNKPRTGAASEVRTI